MKLDHYTAERLRLAQRIARWWDLTPGELKFLIVLVVALWSAIGWVSLGYLPLEVR